MYCNVKIRKGGENSKLASEVSTKDEKKIKIKIKNSSENKMVMIGNPKY